MSSKTKQQQIMHYHRTREILFQAIPKLFARLEEKLDVLGIAKMSFYTPTGMWEWIGKQDYSPKEHSYYEYKIKHPTIDGHMVFTNGKNALFSFETTKEPSELNKSWFLNFSPVSSITTTQEQRVVLADVIVEWYTDTVSGGA